MATRRFLAYLGLHMSLLSPSFAQIPNALTDTEKAEGWQLMFDGRSLSGWHSFKKTSITENGWIVKDSAIYLRGPAAGGLLAPETYAYKNFEIAIDWKLPDSGNSGIFLRYLETEDRESIRTGPETQVCGALHPDYQGGTSVTSPGACYAMYAPAQPWIRPAEEYNTLRVIMYENKVAHYGNGLKLLEYVIGDPDWTARYDSSKYQYFPLYGDIHAGKLFLQDHASHVWYRNVKIRPLARDPWSDPAFLWPDQRTPILAARRAGRAITMRLGGGRIALSSESPRRWDLRLFDPSGRARADFRGAGSGVLATAPAAPGFYLIAGEVDGARLSRPLCVPSR